MKKVKLFFRYVWRKDQTGGRINISTAWSLAKLIGSKPKINAMPAEA
jgi:hypothetical protein